MTIELLFSALTLNLSFTATTLNPLFFISSSYEITKWPLYAPEEKYKLESEWERETVKECVAHDYAIKLRYDEGKKQRVNKRLKWREREGLGHSNMNLNSLHCIF